MLIHITAGCIWLYARIHLYVSYMLTIGVRAMLYTVPAWLGLMLFFDGIGKKAPSIFVVFGAFVFVRTLYLSIFSDDVQTSSNDKFENFDEEDFE